MRRFAVQLYKPGNSHAKVTIRATGIDHVYEICKVQFYDYQVMDIREVRT